MMRRFIVLLALLAGLLSLGVVINADSGSRIVVLHPATYLASADL